MNQQLRYDGAGNMTREVATFGAGAGSGNGAGVTDYSYDTNDRLTGESSTRFGNYSRTHGYDAAYNRTTRSAPLDGANTPWSETATVTNNNQLGTVTHTENSVTTRTSTHSYDGEGNRTLVSTTAGGVTTQTTYLYDREGRLSQVSNKVGAAAAIVAFKAGYRADGLRAWKENGAGTRTYFLYDGSNVLAEFDDTGAIRALNTWGAAGLVSRRTYPTSGGSTVRYYVWDVRGNIAAVTDGSGAILSTPKSEGYFSSGGDGNDPNATFGGQVGGYLDVETGLILFQNRYYDRNNGIWLTRDPIGEAGGINLYAYVGGNPVNRVDPSGLSWGDYLRGLADAVSGFTGFHPSAWFGNDNEKPSIVNSDPENMTGATTLEGGQEIVHRGSVMVGDGMTAVMSACPAPEGNWFLPRNGGGAQIEEFWFTEHALERMAPNTLEVQATLERRYLERAEKAGVQPGTQAFKQWWSLHHPDPRGIPPSVILNEARIPGSTNVTVIKDGNRIITVIPK